MRPQTTRQVLANFHKHFFFSLLRTESDFGKVFLAERLGQIFIDMGQRGVQPGRYINAWVGMIFTAGQKLGVNIIAEHIKDGKKELNPAKPIGVLQVGKDQPDFFGGLA